MKGLVGALGFSLSVLLAGCAGNAGHSLDGAELVAGGAEEGSFVVVIVVDAEILPVPGSDVRLDPGDYLGTTDDAGKVMLGPVAPGTYRLFASKEGYRHAETSLEVLGEPTFAVTVQLEPIRGDVPYHVTEIDAAYIECTVTITYGSAANTTGSLAHCNIEDGTRQFSVLEPGLANALHEMQWKPQSTGPRMNVGILMTGTVVQTYVMDGRSLSPSRFWLWAGLVGPGGTAPFLVKPGTTYYEWIKPTTPFSSTPGVALVIGQRLDVYLTSFYNRPGHEEFTSVPDA